MQSLLTHLKNVEYNSKNVSSSERIKIEKLMWDRETRDKGQYQWFIRGTEIGRRWATGQQMFFVLFVFWLPLPMLRYVTAILNNVVQFRRKSLAVALTGKSGFRVHARCAMLQTGASHTIINCMCARAQWAAELRKFSNCRWPNVYRGIECKIFMLYKYTYSGRYNVT